MASFKCCEKCREVQIKDLCPECFDSMREALKQINLYPFDQKKWGEYLAPWKKNHRALPNPYESNEYAAFTFWWEERERGKKRVDYWNLPEHMDEVWRRDAHIFVRKAVKRGVLPDLRNGDIACVDCGAVATVWEHRSYSRPLDVEPTCRGCNVRRGTAHWPSAADYNFTRIEHA